MTTHEKLIKPAIPEALDLEQLNTIVGGLVESAILSGNVLETEVLVTAIAALEADDKIYVINRLAETTIEFEVEAEAVQELTAEPAAVGIEATDDDKDLPQYNGALDLLSLFTSGVSKVNLLTPYQEIELAKRIEAGDEQAKHHMIVANLRLVIKMARSYMSSGMAFMDLIQEGSIGLMRAVEKFDRRRGYKLSTYATWWIRQSLSRAVADHSRTIRLPVHKHDELKRLKRDWSALTAELGREPTDAELAERAEMPVNKVVDLSNITMVTTSLNELAGESKDTELGELLPDLDAPDPADSALASERRKALQDSLDRLPKREREIMELRYGLFDGYPRTLDEIGMEFGVTRERVRQIEQTTLQTLSTLPEAQVLKPESRPRQPAVKVLNVDDGTIAVDGVKRNGIPRAGNYGELFEGHDPSDVINILKYELNMSDNTIQVLARRVGLNGLQPQGFRDISEALGITQAAAQKRFSSAYRKAAVSGFFSTGSQGIKVDSETGAS